jgi:hypothetical protein
MSGLELDADTEVAAAVVPVPGPVAPLPPPPKKVREASPNASSKRKSTSSSDAGSASKRRRGNTTDDLKECTDCKKTLKPSDFPEGHSDCSDCFNISRCLKRVAQKQGVTKDLAIMKTKDPKQYCALTKGYIKWKTQEDKLTNKTSFSIKSFMEEYKSKEGRRVEQQCEWMWEGQYLEFAKSAAGGFLSVTEAQSKWNEMVGDEENYARDENGPRGYLQIEVPTRRLSMKYTEMSNEKTVQLTQRLARNLSDSVLEQKLRQASSFPWTLRFLLSLLQAVCCSLF